VGGEEEKLAEKRRMDKEGWRCRKKEEGGSGRVELQKKGRVERGEEGCLV
jgi:hypothetical protein